MKTSLHWLNQYFPINWNARELAEILTLAGLEVESIVSTEQTPDSVLVGENSCEIITKMNKELIIIE